MLPETLLVVDPRGVRLTEAQDSGLAGQLAFEVGVLKEDVVVLLLELRGFGLMDIRSYSHEPVFVKVVFDGEIGAIDASGLRFGLRGGGGVLFRNQFHENLGLDGQFAVAVLDDRDTAGLGCAHGHTANDTGNGHHNNFSVHNYSFL